MRVVINRKPAVAGYGLGIAYSAEHAEQDYFTQCDIDNVLLDLTVEVGWLDDL